jgi:hypothetical protein
MGTDLPDPFVPLINPVSATFAGEGQHHLSCSPGFGDNPQCYHKIPNRILSCFNGLDRGKRDLFWGQDIFYPVNKNNSFVGEDCLKRN